MFLYYMFLPWRNMKDNEVIDILHIARNSYYKYKKEMKMEKKSKSDA